MCIPQTKKIVAFMNMFGLLKFIVEIILKALFFCSSVESFEFHSLLVVTKSVKNIK